MNIKLQIGRDWDLLVWLPVIVPKNADRYLLSDNGRKQDTIG